LILITHYRIIFLIDINKYYRSTAALVGQVILGEKDEGTKAQKENYNYYFANISGIDITACRCPVRGFNRII
jgi:hypothetical protein